MVLVNAEILRLTDTDDGLVTVLYAEGAGEGINRPLLRLEATAERLAAYGRREAWVEFPGAVDAADLQAKAQAWLDEKSDPAKLQQVRVRVIGPDRIYRVGDKVRIGDGQLGVDLQLRVQKATTSGGEVTLELGAPAISLADLVAQDREEERQERALGLPAPSGFRVQAAHPGALVLLNPYAGSRAVGVEIHASTTAGFTPDRSTLKARGPGTRFQLRDLSSGTTYYIKARSFDAAGSLSSFTAEASVTAGKPLPPGVVEAEHLAAGIRPVHVFNDPKPNLPQPGVEPGDHATVVGGTDDGKIFVAKDNNADGVAEAWELVPVEAQQVVGELVAGQIAAGAIAARHLAVIPATTSGINPSVDLLLQWRETLASTQGLEPNAGHDARLEPRMGAVGDAVRVGTSLAYAREEPAAHTIIAWRSTKVWNDYAGLTWNDLEAM